MYFIYNVYICYIRYTVNSKYSMIILLINCLHFFNLYGVISSHPGTYNKMTLMPLRSRSRVKESVVLTRTLNQYIHNYIISLSTIMLIHFLIIRIETEL